MPEYSKASDEMQERFEEAWEDTRDKVDDEIFDALDDHIDEVKGKNRGKMSSVDTSARNGPPIEPSNVTIQNDGSERIIHHELGHLIMDALGYDCTQEATNRANNKSNYSRWPQFSFGKKDSPPERFMFRNYGALGSLPQTTDWDLEDVDGRSDIFYFDNEWYEANSYGTVFGKYEHMRHQDPMVRDDNPIDIKLTSLRGHNTFKPIQGDTEVALVDRYKLTPGLAEITEADVQVEWSGIDRLVYEVNRHWYEAVTLVRKRGEERERGQKMSPRGKSKSYYLMNCHEYFAELHSVMMNEQSADIMRLEEYVPHVVEAYRDVIFD